MYTCQNLLYHDMFLNCLVSSNHTRGEYIDYLTSSQHRMYVTQKIWLYWPTWFSILDLLRQTCLLLGPEYHKQCALFTILIFCFSVFFSVNPTFRCSRHNFYNNMFYTFQRHKIPFHAPVDNIRTCPDIVLTKIYKLKL